MTEPSEENVALLVNMGFLDEGECRYALRLSKNDIFYAIGYLTDETPGLAAAPPPPLYPNPAAPDKATTGDEGDPLDFPSGHLYQLEERVLAASWNVPYRREESLGRCLASVTALAAAGLLSPAPDATPHRSLPDAQRFLSRVLPESFSKLPHQQPGERLE